MSRSGLRATAAFLYAGASVMVFAACLASPALAQSAGKGTTLTVASYGGFLDEVFKEAFKPFEESRNVSIRWAPAASAENVARVAASKASPEFDVAFTDSLSARLGSRQGLFAQFDESIVTNYKDLYPQALFPNKDVAAVGFYYTGLFYQPAEFERRGWAPPRSWQDLFRPEFCKHLGTLHPNISYGLHMVMMMSGGDAARMSDSIAKIGKLKDCVQVLEPSASKLEEKIQLGEYLVGVNGNIRVIPLIRRGYPIRFVFPEEGSILAGAVVAPVKNAPNPKLAQDFVNWILGPEAQKVVLARAFYGPANRTVPVPDDLQELGVPDGERMKKMIPIDEEAVGTRRRAWIREIEQAMSR